jgi:hypothetical protein
VTVLAFFCRHTEIADHLFVSCHTAHFFWNWIAKHNNFTFTGSTLQDLWIIDFCIPLKDRSLVELLRSAVCWTLWK